MGISGLFICGLGLAAVFFRDTEELVVDIQAAPEGSRIVMSGKAKASLVTTINSTLARFEGYAPASIGSTAALGNGQHAGPAFSPDRRYWWDGTAWQDASLAAPPNAPRGPDGLFWWDGEGWRPLPEVTPPGPGAT